MRYDLISDVLSAIKNGDDYGKKEVVTPASKAIKSILLLLQKHGYIGDFELIDDKKGGKFKVQLLGKVNSCSSVRPRVYVRKDEYEKYEKRFLPAAYFGFLIVSTSKGIMTHTTAKEKGYGGVLLGYVY